MAKPVIEIESIGKRYSIAGPRAPYQTFRDQISNTLARSINSRPKKQDYWALRNVSFAVNQGEAIGIIGRNGAGKSTLLKILSQITPPTEGRITMRGRVASLLEVGTGFHPELSGRENIFLNGSILGMKRREILSKFDEIVEFSELGGFLDTPVKRYSSGMYVKLAFAVAAHLDPEILIIDEVLAVGDRAFQKRCLGKMGEVAKGGRTVLFVSHDIEAVLALCSKGVLLKDGTLNLHSSVERCVQAYVAPDNDSGDCDQLERHRDGLGAEIRIISVKPVKSTAIGFEVGEPVVLRLGYRLNASIPEVRVGLTVHNQRGRPISTAFTQLGRLDPNRREGYLLVSIRQFQLAPGTYFVSASLGIGNARSDRIEFDIVKEATAFTVQQESLDTTDRLTWSSNAWGEMMNLEVQMEAVI